VPDRFPLALPPACLLPRSSSSRASLLMPAQLVADRLRKLINGQAVLMPDEIRNS
jgi:hypothetical protein